MGLLIVKGEEFALVGNICSPLETTRTWKGTPEVAALLMTAADDRARNLLPFHPARFAPDRPGSEVPKYFRLRSPLVTMMASHVARREEVSIQCRAQRPSHLERPAGRHERPAGRQGR